MTPHLVEHPAHGVKCLHNLRIPMEDGVRLAADLYAPLSAPLDGSEPLPVVMEYIPYRKDDVGVPVDSHWYGYLPLHGYLVLRVDCRGTGASEGITGDEYTLREQRDGHDAIEWCAAQPWCDGHVNMIGISYGGFTSLQVASHAPPHLTSIVPIDFTDDRYTDDCHYRGGHARMLLDPGFYGAFMVAFNALPPAPARSLANWAEIWETAPRRGRAVRARVAAAPDRRAVLAQRLRRRGRGSDPLPGVHDRRLARRLSEPAAAPVREPRAYRAGC